MTKEVVVAYVSHNSLPAGELPDLINRVYGSLSKLNGVTSPGESEEAPAPVQHRQEPAVAIRNSVKPDYIVCLEDGHRCKVLTRYIKTHFGLTPKQYRDKWGLPKEYPMTAPNYSTLRANLANAGGLGERRRKRVVQPDALKGPAGESLAAEG